jgi:integrase
VDEALHVDAILNTIRSSSLTAKDAERVVLALKDQELIETAVIKTSPGSESLITFLERFWTFDSSAYVREKLAHGHRIGRRHCYDMKVWVKTYWKLFFTERRLSEICRANLKDFSLWLAESKNLKPKTINNVLAAGTVALKWAHENDLIAANPTDGLVKFSGKAAKRGVLTDEEVERLFTVQWADERARLGSILAMSTGLRAGEVLAVQVRDIDTDRLRVRHSWSNLDGLKSPKTGEERTVPLIEHVREALLALAKKNPHGVGPSTFVYWSSDRDNRPMDFHCLLDGLKDALLRLSLTEEDLKDQAKVQKAIEYWKARG